MGDPVVARFTLHRTQSYGGWAVNYSGRLCEVLCAGAAEGVLGIRPDAQRVLLEVTQGVITEARGFRLLYTAEDEDQSLVWADEGGDPIDMAYPWVESVLEAAGFTVSEPFHVTVLEQHP